MDKAERCIESNQKRFLLRLSMSVQCLLRLGMSAQSLLYEQCHLRHSMCDLMCATFHLYRRRLLCAA